MGTNIVIWLWSPWWATWPHGFLGIHSVYLSCLAEAPWDDLSLLLWAALEHGIHIILLLESPTLSGSPQKWVLSRWQFTIHVSHYWQEGHSPMVPALLALESGVSHSRWIPSSWRHLSFSQKRQHKMGKGHYEFPRKTSIWIGIIGQPPFLKAAQVSLIGSRRTFLTTTQPLASLLSPTGRSPGLVLAPCLRKSDDGGWLSPCL
jgi:hypothetical protein